MLGKSNMVRRLLSDTWVLARQVIQLQSSREVYTLLTLTFVAGLGLGAIIL